MSTKRQARPLRFIETDTGCYVCISHKPNKDGYIRKAWGSSRGKDRQLSMLHRVLWEHKHGPIPEGYEINHLCRNRMCQNTCHMECISGKEHTIKTNRDRYADRKEEARSHWLNTRCSGTELASVFGVSFSSGCKWIRQWKKAEKK